MLDDSMTVQSFSSEIEAHLARTMLKSAGIEATVHRFSRYRAMAAGGYVLKVAPPQFKRASKILEKMAQPVDMDEYISSDDESVRRCPSCQSANVEARPLPAKLLALGILGLGVPLLFIKRDRTCRKCGHTWRE